MSDQQRAGEVPETSELRYQKLGPQTHTRDRRPSTAAWPACWAMGTIKLNQCTVRKKNICSERLSGQGEQKSLGLMFSCQICKRKISCHLFMNPLFVQFKRQSFF